ncbi:hypothetical protein FLK61_31290 [Paenalkalicoccus suaedae]|uniref:Uncharacterized protein n=1 Tax=Paenalkalicoccus suaedae TaxID=2592382 RepID=A0A859FEA1_9BACI|nr:hypothetical protein [Paenalkalicoccus suaedae]QKS71200.1 hypothetical protein FLK61_31290 [Paenalkalicoccus suaedae]
MQSDSLFHSVTTLLKDLYNDEERCYYHTNDNSHKECSHELRQMILFLTSIEPERSFHVTKPMSEKEQRLMLYDYERVCELMFHPELKDRLFTMVEKKKFQSNSAQIFHFALSMVQ